MNDVVEELRERAATVSAPPVVPDWARLRRARRVRRGRQVAATTAGVVVVVGAATAGYDVSRRPEPAVLAVTATPGAEASQPAASPQPPVASQPPASPQPPVASQPAASPAPPVVDAVQQPLTSYAGRSLAQLAEECQTWAPGVATPGSDPQLRGLVADSAGAVAAITTDQEASSCEFLPDGSVDTSGANDGPYGPHNPAASLPGLVSEITVGSGITHRLDSKDRNLQTPVRDTFIARVGREVAYVVVDFDGHTVRSTPGQGVVTATQVRSGKVTALDITYAAYDADNDVIAASSDASGHYRECDPVDGSRRSDPSSCPAIPWP